jgi:hypothetical protein
MSGRLAALREADVPAGYPIPDNRGPGERVPCKVCPGTGWVRHNSRHAGLCGGCKGYGTCRIAPTDDLADLPAADRLHLNLMLRLIGGEEIGASPRPAEDEMEAGARGRTCHEPTG